MTRLWQGSLIVAGSIAATIVVLAIAVAWGPHRCNLGFPDVVGCALGSYEGLAGGMIAATAALVGGWLAWSAVQLQISAEEQRADADRKEVEGLLRDDVLRLAEGLAAIWRILDQLDPSKEIPSDQLNAVVWGIGEVAKEKWLSSSRNMVKILGWERRNEFEELLDGLEGLRRFLKKENFDAMETISAVRDVSIDFEICEPTTSEYFEGLFRRSGKAMTIGEMILQQAGKDPYAP